MQYWWRAVLALLAQLLASILVPLAVRLAKYEGNNEINVAGYRAAIVPRYRLPRVFRWMETQDDRNGALPGGLYERAIYDVYLAKGWRAAARAWLWRNRAYRFSRLLGVTIPKPEAPVDQRDAIERWRILSAGQPLSLSSLDGRHLIVMQMRGEGDPGVSAGQWRGEIVVTDAETGKQTRVWCRRIVSKPFLGRMWWAEAGWKLNPYFDCIRDGIDWPAPSSATGMVSTSYFRAERVI